MVYSAHFDASGTHKHPVITIAGGIASVDRWVKLEHAWNKTLTTDGLPMGTVFRMSEFVQCNGVFSIYKDQSAKKAALFAGLVSCVVKHVSKMFSVSVVIEDYRAFDTAWCFHETFGSPYSFAGLMCIKNSLDWLNKSTAKRKHPLEVFFEKGDVTEDVPGGLERELGDLCEKYFEIEPLFKGKSMTQFQPGDMLAWKNRIAVTDAHLHGHTQDLDKLDSIQRSLKELERIHAMNGVYNYSSFAKVAKGEHIPSRQTPLSLIARS
jgi:hypothetical protein